MDLDLLTQLLDDYAMPVGIWAADSAGSTLLVNQAAADMIGYQAEEILGRTIFEFMPDKSVRDAQRLIATREQRGTETFQFTLQHQNGDPVQVLVTSEPLTRQKEAAGSVSFITSLGELHQQHELAWAVASHSPVMLSMDEPDGNCLFMSAGWQDFVGYSSSVILANGWKGIFDPEFTAHYIAGLEEVERLETPLRRRMPALRQDGQKRILEVHLAPFRRPGLPLRILTSAYDVSDQVQAEKELEESHRLWSSTIECLPTGVLVMDQDGYILEHNPAAARLLNSEPGGLKLRRVDQISEQILDQEGKALTGESNPCLRVMKTLSPERAELQVKGAAERWLSMRVEPQITDGYLTGIVASIADVSLQVNQRRQLAKLAYFDSMTGLKNEAGISQTLSEWVRQSSRSGHSILVAALTLKGVSQEHPKEQIRQSVMEATSRLNNASGCENEVAYCGGGELILVARSEAQESAKEWAQNMLQAICRSGQQVLTLPSGSIDMQARVGAAYLSVEMLAADELIRQSRVARSASSVGNWEIYVSWMDEQAGGRALAESLKAALQGDETELKLKPLADLSNGSSNVYYAEAHYETLPGAELADTLAISKAAHAAGLSVALTQLIWTESCQVLAGWQKEGRAAAIMVGLPSDALKSSAMISDMLRTIDESQVASKNLIGYVRRSQLTDKAAMDGCQTLHEMGVRLALGGLEEDRGIGWSGIATIPWRMIVIEDQSVQAMQESERARNGIRSLINAIHGLGSQSVIGNLDNEAALQLAKELQCELGYGAQIGGPQAPALAPQTIETIF